jgi:hypothetical protein
VVYLLHECHGCEYREDIELKLMTVLLYFGAKAGCEWKFEYIRRAHRGVSRKFAPMAESGPGTGDCETFRVMLVNLTSKDCHTDLIHARNAWQLTSIRVLFEFAEDC